MSSETGVGSQLFVSDLSVGDYLLLKKAGFNPLGLVIGSSIYDIGFQNVKINQSQEVESLTKALSQARNTAAARMIAEAASLKADGIIGIKTTVKLLPWGENLAEFVSVGTAVAHSNRGSYVTAKGRPFTSSLVGTEFVDLINSGCRPVSFLTGNCVYFVDYQSLPTEIARVGRNNELNSFTAAVTTARETAVSRMQQEAEHWGGDGILGSTISENSFIWYKHIVEFMVAGNSIITRSS